MTTGRDPFQTPGVLSYLLRNARLAWRLFRDPRVSLLGKVAVPTLFAAYLLSPVDLLPDLVPVLGQVDDLAILALAVRFFIGIAPPDVVRQHLADLAGAPRRRSQAADTVVDADYRVVD